MSPSLKFLGLNVSPATCRPTILDISECLLVFINSITSSTAFSFKKAVDKGITVTSPLGVTTAV